MTVGETVLMLSLFEGLRAATRVRMESQQLTSCPTSFPELELHPSTTAHNTVGDNKPAYVTTTVPRLRIVLLQALKSAVSEPEIYGLDVREIRAQAIGPSAPFREIRLGDGLRDDRMQIFLRRFRFLELQDLLRVGGGDRGGDGADAAVVRAARAGESEVRRHSTIIPLDVEACSRARALTCGCHSDSVASTRAAWSRFCGFFSFPAR